RSIAALCDSASSGVDRADRHRHARAVRICRRVDREGAAIGGGYGARRGIAAGLCRRGALIPYAGGTDRGSMIDIIPSGETLGATVAGVDLNQPLDDRTFAQIL